MKVQLTAGAEVDLLSPSEMHKEVDRLEVLLQGMAKVDPTTLVRGGSVPIDSSGNVGGGSGGIGTAIYTARAGTLAELCRITMSTTLGASGSAASPLTTAGAWVALYVGQTASDSLELFSPAGTSGVLPFVYATGDDQAIVLRQHQSLLVVGANLPVSINLGYRLKVRLWPNPQPASVPTVEAG